MEKFETECQEQIGRKDAQKPRASIPEMYEGSPSKDITVRIPTFTSQLLDSVVKGIRGL
jgi:hypothetical protein